MANRAACCLILHFITLFLVQSCMFNFANAATFNVTTDQSALLALKAHISYDPHHVFINNWSTSTFVCDWVGVTCGSKHLRVKALNLSYMGLVGTIPPHIGNLSFLVRISFVNNSFHGSMPNELSYLHRLEYLNFGYNEFSGEIPSQIGFLTKLQYLGLYGNNFEGTIPPSLSNITSLQRVSLQYNKLSGSIPSSIFNIFGLQQIRLRGNKLTGPMPSILFNMPSLQLIDLSYNMLVGTLPMYIFDHLPNVQIISVSSNQLHGQLPSTLYKCKQLQVLSLSLNNFNGRISPEIGNLTMLTELYLFSNSFEGTIASSSGLFECKDLKMLNLAINNFTGRIPPKIGNLTVLTELYLHRNNFEGVIPSEIGNLPKIEICALSENRFLGPIPFEITNISTIQHIGMAFNNLSGQLPSNLGLFLPKLQNLLLAGNKLTGTIPSSISNASLLVDLDMPANLFSGLIPKTLGNLRLLTRLNLSDNNLTAALSLFSYFANCLYLRVFGLSKSNLNGFLPDSVGNLSLSLEHLDLESCNLRGNIPTEIGNLSGLIILSLPKNKFVGPIPTTIGRLHKLQVLDLEGNRLDGPIPSRLCHLRNLGALKLHDNKLSGHIPACLNNMSSLRAFHLGFNQLTSKLPWSLWTLKDLLSIDLSYNSISGPLSPEIGNMKVLIMLDLSQNQLSGDIPVTIGGLKTLVNLSLAVNQLEGSIPPSFGGLVSLELLDLSYNDLSGEIPKSLEALLYLKYLNVSFNKLRGEIPRQGPFVHFSATSFMSNDALCGESQLQVPSCKEGVPRPKQATRAQIIKYVLPASILGLTILVVSLVLASAKCKKRFAKLPSGGGSLPLATWRRISYQEVLQATEGFSANNLLGEGSFGSVYKGTLFDGMNVAIKVLNLQIEGAFKSFDVECEVLRNIRHRNLVKIISVCSNMDFKALVLEYMPNGNLEMWLHSENLCLDMLQRLNIMIDVAAALEYLHLGYSIPIVHCDLKPSNVLLDEDMVGYVIDFGIAKLLSDGVSLTQTMTLATIGYMAPEYGSGGHVSLRGDVYSYGILLMETFTRKKPTDDMFNEEMSLKCLVEESLSLSIIDVVDTKLLRNESDFAAVEECLSSTMGLALHCCGNTPDQRIDIKKVSATLNKIKLKFLENIGGG